MKCPDCKIEMQWTIAQTEIDMFDPEHARIKNVHKCPKCGRVKVKKQYVQVDPESVKKAITEAHEGEHN